MMAMIGAVIINARVGVADDIIVALLLSGRLSVSTKTAAKHRGRVLNYPRGTTVAWQMD